MAQQPDFEDCLIRPSAAKRIAEALAVDNPTKSYRHVIYHFAHSTPRGKLTANGDNAVVEELRPTIGDSKSWRRVDMDIVREYA